MKNLNKTLHFNEKEINLVFADGQWWVAVKPICEALGVDYKAQHKSISEEDMAPQLSSIQRMTGADGKNYEMFCIAEKFVYGWLFSIRSGSPELKAYKLECYNVLWNHFHGRFSALMEKMDIEEEMAQIEADLLTDDRYRKLRELEDRKKKIAPALRKMDNDLLKGQIRLDFQTTAP